MILIHSQSYITNLNSVMTGITTPTRKSLIFIQWHYYKSEFMFFSIIDSKYRDLLLTLRSQTDLQTTPVG